VAVDLKQRVIFGVCNSNVHISFALYSLFLYLKTYHELQNKGRAMKDGIHPVYKKSIVTCVCGNKFETRSSIGNIRIEICSACHPFYTGKQKLLDSAGRVERFKRKYAKKEAAAAPATGV
jgi:large subunit ribosomal protein L31